MAKPKAKVNKSASIRELLARNPDITAKEIQSTLARKGIKVTPNTIYTVKTKLKAEKPQQRASAAKPKVTGATRKATAPNPAEAVLQVKKLAQDLGGIKDLKQLVDAIAD